MPRLVLPSPSDNTALALVYNRIRQLAAAIHIERGTASFTTDSGFVTFTDIVFDAAFTGVPTVTATPVTAVPNALWCSVSNVTVNGFRLHAYRAATGSASSSFAWVAVR